MAAVETNVLDAHDGYVTKVEAAVDGARRTYELTHKPAQVGDLVRAQKDGSDITKGAYYRATKTLNTATMFADDNGDNNGLKNENLEVFEKVAPAAPRFEVGQLAKVAAEKDGHQFDIGEIVKVTHKYAEGSYRAHSLDGESSWAVGDYEVKPYTPQAGDELTVSGAEYTLRDRKAQTGEKVIVTDNSTNGFAENSIVEAVNDAAEFSGEIVDDAYAGDQFLSTGQYLVLEPKKVAPFDNITWISAAESEAEDESESDEITVNHNINVNVNTEIDVESLADELAELIRRKSERIARARGEN
jgi:cytochrome c1